MWVPRVSRSSTFPLKAGKLLPPADLAGEAASRCLRPLVAASRAPFIPFHDVTRYVLKRFSCSCLCAALLVAGQVQAQDAEGLQDPADGMVTEGVADPRYEEAINEAVAEFSAGRWEEARALFTEAHRINPNARTLRGLGMAAFELRNYVEARQMLTQSLASEVNPLTSEQRDKTEALLERTNAFVGVFTLEAPVGTAISVDGGPASLDGEGRVLLNGGKHTIDAALSGYPSQRRSVDVRGGEVGTLVFDFAQPLAPVSPPASVSPTGVVDGRSAALAAPVDESATPILPWVLVGGGGVLLASALVTGIVASHAFGKLEDACGDLPEQCPRRFKSDANRADTFAAVTDVLWIGGVLAAGAGVTLWLLDKPADEEPTESPSLSVSAGLTSVSLRGQF